jgi:hypothetical protein
MLDEGSSREERDMNLRVVFGVIVSVLACTDRWQNWLVPYLE